MNQNNRFENRVYDGTDFDEERKIEALFGVEPAPAKESKMARKGGKSAPKEISRKKDG